MSDESKRILIKIQEKNLQRYIMKKKSRPGTFLFIFLGFILFAGCSSTKVISDLGSDLGTGEIISFNGRTYHQTFLDDFNQSELDYERWERCPEWQRQDQGGYWNNKCSYLEDGNLVIEAKIKNGSLLSGAIRSKNKFEQRQGLFKIRFKAEKASGLWYAFWLMSDNEHKILKGAKNGGEIDIVEILPNDPYMPEEKKTYLNSAVHWDGYKESHKSHSSQYFIDDSFYEQWHEITFEWTDEYYKAYLDDNEVPYWDSTIDGAEAWGGIVEDRNYMKISAEFGTWGGPVDKNALPAKLFVDWVKVYKAD